MCTLSIPMRILCCARFFLELRTLYSGMCCLLNLCRLFSEENNHLCPEIACQTYFTMNIYY